MTDEERDPIPLTPDDRAKVFPAGTPVTLADGATWLLCDGGLLNELDDLRDRIDDASRLKGSVPMHDVALAAAELLAANYELTAREAWSLLSGVVDQALADVVFTALFGPQAGRRTYTSWAASALIANGIDPTAVPTALLPHVLAQLEGTGRCLPRDRYIESAEAGRRLAGIRARAVQAPAPARMPAGEP